jgi:hypothetical protein
MDLLTATRIDNLFKSGEGFCVRDINPIGLETKHNNVTLKRYTSNTFGVTHTYAFVEESTQHSDKKLKPNSALDTPFPNQFNEPAVIAIFSDTIQKMVDDANKIGSFYTVTSTPLNDVDLNDQPAIISGIKTNSTWQKLYGLANDRKLIYVNNDGNKVEEVTRETMPCHYCGILLPLKLIQVDHRQPKAIPGLGVLKGLHMLDKGYTKAPGKGQKFTQFKADFQGIQKIPPKGRSTAGLPGKSSENELDPEKLKRYTLTNKGRALITILHAAHGKNYSRFFVNSLLNFVPSCARCNGAAGKGDKPHVSFKAMDLS